MSAWDNFPSNYRQAEVCGILRAVRAGACVSLSGLSGAGKSNLLGFLAHRCNTTQHPLALVDCNRLLEHTPAALLQLSHRVLGETVAGSPADPFEALNQAINIRLERAATLTLFFDRFDIFASDEFLPLHNALRSLRDAHKYQLAYLFATRRPLPPTSELAELVQANTVWLGPLSEADARWNVERFARRHGERWSEETVQQIVWLSQGYPSFLKAACEAFAAGTALADLTRHPAVQARIAEFWLDEPTAEQLKASRLLEHPLLQGHGAATASPLTAKEQLLYDYLQAHAGQVCDKDDLIRAVWPEDAIYEEGVRDSSLAQLVRRLRLKVEPDPSKPRLIETVPGRGYLFRK